MISFVTGKPGGGKGLLSVQLIVDELRFGKRPIITNLPLRLFPWVNGKMQAMIGLQAYLFREYGTDFDCEKRVFILDDDEAGQFYLWRVVKTENGGVKLQKAQANVKVVEKDGIREERVMDFETTIHVDSGPVFYVIDEAWKFYGSRNWQKTGEGMLFYSAQHRHFGDDVLIVTQHTKQIDPAILRVAQDFWTVTNHGNLTFGFFRQPAVFHVRIFDSPPTGASMTPMSRKIFRLDRSGIAQCYDTSAGVGIAGRAVADLGSRKRGLPVWMMVAFAIVAIFCLFKGFSYIPKMLMYPFHKQNEKLTHDVKSQSPYIQARHFQTNSIVVNKGEFQSPKKDLQNSFDVKTQLSSEQTNEIVCTGYTMVPTFASGVSRVFVTLSDGRTADSFYGEVQSVERWKVKVFGEEFKIVTKPQAWTAAPSPAGVIQLPVDDGVSQPAGLASPVTAVIPMRPAPMPVLQGVQARMQQSSR